MLNMGRLTCVLAFLSVSAMLALDVAHAAPGRDPFAVEEATIADIQKALMSKRITAVELVHLYLERIKAFNGTCVHEPAGDPRADLHDCTRRKAERAHHVEPPTADESSVGLR